MKEKYNRKWLNPPSSSYTGYIQYGVNVAQNWVGVTLKLADCSRIVSFDFESTHEKTGRKAAIKKITIMRDAMNHLIDEITKVDIP